MIHPVQLAFISLCLPSVHVDQHDDRGGKTEALSLSETHQRLLSDK